MSNGRIRRWALLGALVSGALVAACDRKDAGSRELDTWPKTGVNEREGVANDAQNVDSFGTEQPASESANQPASGGSGFQQEQDVQGAPGTTTPREDGRGSEVLRDGQTWDRNQGSEEQH